MATFHVLVTDYAWSSLDMERALLSELPAELLVAETGEENDLLRLAPEADAILTNWNKVTPAILDAAPHCRIVSRYGIGLDNIAVDHATHLGILVTNCPDFCLDEVSDHALALLLACSRRIVTFARSIREGTWDVKIGRPISRLRGRTLGLVGYGNTARALVPKAAALGLRILAYTPRLTPDALAPWGAATNDLGHLLREADFVSLHLPLTPDTHGLIDRNALRHMKPTAYLINTSRGALVDEDALADALQEGRIAGAALDVLTTEPPEKDHPLGKLDQVILTPHAAFYSEDAVLDVQRKATEQVVQVLRCQTPKNLVNPSVLKQPNCRLTLRKTP